MGKFIIKSNIEDFINKVGTPIKKLCLYINGQPYLIDKNEVTIEISEEWKYGKLEPTQIPDGISGEMIQIPLDWTEWVTIDDSGLEDIISLPDRMTDLEKFKIYSIELPSLSEIKNFTGLFNSWFFVESIIFPDEDIVPEKISSMFKGCHSLLSLDLRNFNTSNVEDFSSLFEGCVKLSNLIISSKFSTESARNLSYMFAGCAKIATLDLSHWEVWKVTDISGMFGKSIVWDIGLDEEDEATGSYEQSGKGCESLKVLDLSGWELNTNLKTFIYQGPNGPVYQDGVLSENLFSGCDKLETLYLENSNNYTIKLMKESLLNNEDVKVIASTVEPSRDEKPLDGRGLKKVFALVEKDFQRVDKYLEQVQDNLDQLNYGSYNYCVAAWEKNSLDPVAIEQYGDPELLKRWDFYFVNHGQVSPDGKSCTPVAKLKRNNIFRDENGNFVKTVLTSKNCKFLTSITRSGNEFRALSFNNSSYATYKLYLNSNDPNSFISTIGDFNAESFWNKYGHTVYSLYATSSNTSWQRVYNIPRPWEEYIEDWENKDVDISKVHSVVLSYPKTCYLLDQVEGKSGKIWKGIFFEPMIWDGIDVSRFALNPTGIGPTPAAAQALTGVSSTASKTSATSNGDVLFTRYVEFYPATASSKTFVPGNNCQGHIGEGDISRVFMSEDWVINNVKYKRFLYGRSYDVSQLTNCNMARNNNTNPQVPYPFAEGGYHSRNVFISSMETLYKTKYLNESNFFASGISANDEVTNEAQWRKYGGIRWKKSSSDTWNYGTWNTTPEDIYYNANKNQTHFNALLSWWYPKEQVLESQTIASFAAEAGIDPGVKFSNFNYVGETAGIPPTYWYENIPGTKGLKDGEMNCIVYKHFIYSFSGYDSSLVPATFNMEIILRMSLMNGYNHSGDYWIYYGGGYEQVGTVTNVENGTTGNPVDIWTCFDQTKWRTTSELQTVSLNNLGKFVFEGDGNYWHAWSGLNLGDSYTAERPSYTAYKSKEGGDLGTGECFWSYTSKHWSTTLNQRIRVGCRNMSSGNDENCGCRRGEHGVKSGVNINGYNIGGSVQVLLSGGNFGE